MKKYRVNLVDKASETLDAETVTYDDVGNLMFLNFKKTIQTPQNPEGKEVELVKCYNARHYVSYELAPLHITH